MKRAFAFVLSAILLSSCTISGSQYDLRNQSSMGGTGENLAPDFETNAGEWTITQFIGTAGVHANYENENEVVGKTIIIDTDSIYYDNRILISAPILEVSLITSDHFILHYRANPETLGFHAGNNYYTFRITGQNMEFGMTLYQQNEEEFVYFRKGKFYKMIRVG